MERVRRFFFCFLLLLACCSHSVAASGQTTHAAGDPGDFSTFEQNGRVGLKNKKGDVIIPAEFEAIGWSNGTFSVVDQVTGYKSKGLWGLITVQNQRITKADYTDLSPGGESVIVARKKINNSIFTQAGCLTPAGKVIVPFLYDGISIRSMRAVVYQKSGLRFRHGLIDLENNVLIPLQYENVYPLGSLRFGVVSPQQKTAIFSEDGKQLTDFMIDSISPLKKNFAVFYQGAMLGLMNREGDVVLEPVYREIVIADDGSVSARKPDAWLFLEGGNKLIRQHNADSIKAVFPDLYQVKLAGKISLTSPDLKPLGTTLFASIEKFSRGKAVFAQQSKKGVVDTKGNIVIGAKYDALIRDENFYFGGKNDGVRMRWQLLDTTGNVLTSKAYESILGFNGNFFPVRFRGYWGGLNKDGREIISCVHDSIVHQGEGKVVVKFRGLYGIIDTHENWIVVPQPNRLRIANREHYLERTSTHLNLKSMKGDLVYFTEHALVSNGDHLLEYKPSGEIWKVSYQGTSSPVTALPPGVKDVSRESEGLRAIRKDGKYGFIDSRSRLRIANRYEDVKDFQESLAAARIRGRWGFISKDDRIAIQPVYDDVSSFNNGLSIVKQKNLFGIIDKSGKVVLPIRYDEISVMESGRYLLRQSNMFGLADLEGKVTLNLKYESVQDLNNGFVIVGREGKFGVITADGMSTIPLIYDGITFDPFHNQYIALQKSSWEKPPVK